MNGYTANKDDYLKRGACRDEHTQPKRVAGDAVRWLWPAPCRPLGR